MNYIMPCEVMRLSLIIYQERNGPKIKRVKNMDTVLVNPQDVWFKNSIT
jgi:hypothetical protein